MRQRSCVVVLVLAVTSVTFLARPAASPATGGVPAPEGRRPPRYQFQGTGSCASAACHQGSGPQGSSGSEYTTWITRDKHAQAYQVLFNAKSKTIVRNLNQGRDSASRLKAAHEEPRCLNCHVLPQYQEANLSPRFARADGVGCESCHGPAEKWLSEHYRPEWRQMTVRAKAGLGFWDTKGLVGRARGCVDCHVGAPGMDVNHDLIAAGHPRLAFEFGAYHALMPRHWNPKKDRAAYPDLEARAWAVGQVVSAEAALKLLKGRAEEATRDEKRQPWPEFAEYDCYACHHDLKAKSWRQSRTHYGQRPPGTMPWDGWYTAMLPATIDGAARKELAELRKIMQIPYPAPRAVQRQAGSLLERLEGWPEKLARRPIAAPSDLVQHFRRIAQEKGAVVESWDEATQLYLTLAAYHNALSDLRAVPSPAWKETLGSCLRPLLAFPPRYDSPRAFDPQAVRKRLRQLQQVGSR